MPTTSPDLIGAIEQLRELVRGDGANLRLVAVDEATRVVEVALELEDASCADCVLPPTRLHQVLSSGLAQRGLSAHRLVLHDPRRAAPGAGGAERILVLDPTAGDDSSDRDSGPDAGPLAGRTVGFRVDVLWTSWDLVVDEWTAALERAGVAIRSWRRVQGLAGDDGAEADASYQEFLAGVDVAVVGLGNCGSCTSWTVKDAVSAAAAGLPTAAVVTDQFLPLAGMLAGHYGRAGLRIHALPFPLQTRPDGEVRAIAREALPNLLATIGASV